VEPMRYACSSGSRFALLPQEKKKDGNVNFWKRGLARENTLILIGWSMEVFGDGGVWRDIARRRVALFPTRTLDPPLDVGAEWLSGRCCFCCGAMSL
jgi:hypothetical protein